jgi:AI-2 transport protein TqsA
VPKWGALAVIIFVLLDIGSLLALVTTGALEGFRDSLPTYQERFLLLSDQLGGWMEGVGVGGSREAIPDLLDPNKVAIAVRYLLSNASGFFATGLLVLLAVDLHPARGEYAAGQAAGRLPDLTEAGDARMKRLLDSIKRYMLIKSLTSLGTAVCVWLWLWFLGIDFAILWAVLAFFLNFIPVVGNIVMMIPAVLLALVQADVSTAI